MSSTEFWSISVEARPGVLYTPRNFAEDSSGIMSLRRVASRVIRWQIGIGLSVTALWAVTSGVEAGLAALVGTGISVFMTFYVAMRWGLKTAGAQEPKAILGAFYGAVTMKLLLGTALIFIAVYAFRDNAGALVITLSLTLAAYGLVLLGDID